MNLQPTIKYKKVKSAEEQWTALYCRLSCDDEYAKGKIQIASS